MSTKPVTIPRWANVSGALVTPASGKLDIGTLPGERPPAQYDNWFKKWTGDWLQYLSDASFTGGVTVDTLTSTAGITLSVNQNVTVSGTGAYKRGQRTRKITARTGTASANNSFTSNWNPAALSNSCAVPLTVDSGERILSVTAHVACGATDVFQLGVFRVQPASLGTTQLGTNQHSVNHSNAIEDIVVSGLTELTTAADEYNYVALLSVTAYGAGSLTFWGIDLVTDIP